MIHFVLPLVLPLVLPWYVVGTDLALKLVLIFYHHVGTVVGQSCYISKLVMIFPFILCYFTFFAIILYYALRGSHWIALGIIRLARARCGMRVPVSTRASVRSVSVSSALLLQPYI